MSRPFFKWEEFEKVGFYSPGTECNLADKQSTCVLLESSIFFAAMGIMRLSEGEAPGDCSGVLIRMTNVARVQAQG